MPVVMDNIRKALPDVYNLSDRLKEQALAPQWDEAGRVHDWRNYISGGVRRLWDTFTDEQKIALVEQADKQASGEDWE